MRLTTLTLGACVVGSLVGCAAKERPEATDGSGGAGAATSAGGSAGQSSSVGAGGTASSASGGSGGAGAAGGVAGGGSAAAGTGGGNQAGNGGGPGSGGGESGGAGGSAGETGNGGNGLGGSAGVGGSSGDPSRNLLFSEYVEGTGAENKALEIYNGGTDWDLATCVLRLYANGAAAPTLISSLSGTIARGGTVTVCHSDYTHDGRCDLTGVAAVNFTGNDVIELVCEDELQDSIGQIGDNPQALYWGTPPVSTMNQTLRRKCEITLGDRDATDAYDPALEWDGFPLNDYDDFGSSACHATTPHPAQVVITGLRRGTPVQVAFSVLSTLGPDTELVFTDNAWSTSNLGFSNSEEVLRVRFPVAISAGTSFVWSADTGLSPNLGSTSGALRDFGVGDQVLLIQTTPQGPRFIFGASCTTQPPGFVLQDAGANQSDLPARLTAPWNAWVDVASGTEPGCVFAGDRVGAESFDTYQRQVGNATNWAPTSGPLSVNNFEKLETF